MVSCSKDEEMGIALDSTKKSVAITIANGNGGTRAAGDGISAGKTAGNATKTVACEAKELTILFADATGKILKTLPLTTQAESDSHIETTGEYAPGKSDEANTYVWHNVPAAITQVAVVRDNQNDVGITTGTTTLDEVQDGATNWDANIARPISEVFLYAETTLEKNTAEHVTVNGTTYYIWEGSMTVAPKFARVELTQISCTDLGALNVDNDPATVALDVITVNSLTWKTNNKSGYTIDANPIGTMYGEYVPEGENATDKVIYANDTETTKVWSWNVQPGEFEGMDLELTATAYDYDVADDSVALKITGLASTPDATTADKNTLSESNIYRIALDFTEDDITGQEGKCVKVVVTIDPWTVNTVYPVFGN
ncbi:MAG: hypothetical protein E7138_05215 [Rikenellaceae bacterium]|nr:hypothetical protein [Rikenellaceae bacterium]